MDRRHFLKLTGAGAMAAAVPMGLRPAIARAAAPAWAADLPDDITITRIVSFRLPTTRSKLAGRNAQLDIHGDSSSDMMARIYTDAGIEALGTSWGGERELYQQLLGRKLTDFYDAESNAMRSPLGRFSMGLWDLAGKAVGKPVHALLSDHHQPDVRVYDGSIYFMDLLPQYADHWQDRLREEIDMGIDAGHRTFKVKIGRGHKWMDRAQGDRRDVEVLSIIREHGGRDIHIGIDANNGYDLPRLLRLMDEVGHLEIDFTEEVFPENVEKYLALKESYRQMNLGTLIADGENIHNLDELGPYLDAGAIDVYQCDMKSLGFEDVRRMARMAGDRRAVVAPHNWGSLIGFYMQVQVGHALPNFYLAERDPLSTDVLTTDGYQVQAGYATAPQAPGMGLSINEDAFAQLTPEYDISI
ncbi:MAG: enolase C-terminal domain-like protein [Phycisphaerales bacterium JB063]